jgi:hypothetical protein
MPHKMDELLQVEGLPTNIDAISDSTGDYEAAPTPHHPHFPYEKADFTSILGNVSIILCDPFSRAPHRRIGGDGNRKKDTEIPP